MPDNRIYVTPVMASCESFLPRKDMTMNLRPTNLSEKKYMRKLFLTLLVAIGAIGVSACSDKPAVYTATKMLGGSSVGVTAKLSLNNFGGDAKEGTGTLEVTKDPSSQWAGSVGTFDVTWKSWDSQGHEFMILVPSRKDAFVLGLNPLTTTLIGNKKSFWCQDCERLRSGAGVGILPGLFLKE
ncbi:hypothetical protein [Cupriavidus pauculus]